MKGFDRMIDVLSSNNRPMPELVHFIFFVFSNCGPTFHKEFVKQLGPQLQTKIFRYLYDMNQNELRNIKKDTLDIITKVLRFYLGLTLGSDERNRIIEEFSITFSLKMIKTNFLEKRIQAVKNLVEIIRVSKLDKDKSNFLLKLIEDNKIFFEIFGTNSHFQLIFMSKDLLEIMLNEDKLSEEEIEMIWAKTKKGDLEGKLTILKILKDVSKSLNGKHVTSLLNNIYNSKSESHEFIDEEIDLIYELSVHKSQSEETVEKCIKFFTSSILTSKSDDGEKNNTLINKIFDITKQFTSFKTSVVKMCTTSLEKVIIHKVNYL